MDDVVPFGAGHCENERVREEHPPTDGAAVIRVGLEEVAELVGVEEPVGGAVGARACSGEDRGWMCPRQRRGARSSARTGGAWGGPWLEEPGRPGACEVAGWGGGERGSASETSAAAVGGGGGPGAASGGAAATRPGGHRELGISAPALMSSMRHNWNFAW